MFDLEDTNDAPHDIAPKLESFFTPSCVDQIRREVSERGYLSAESYLRMMFFQMEPDMWARNNGEWNAEATLLDTLYKIRDQIEVLGEKNIDPANRRNLLLSIDHAIFLIESSYRDEYEH